MPSLTRRAALAASLTAAPLGTACAADPVPQTAAPQAVPPVAAPPPAPSPAPVPAAPPEGYAVEPDGTLLLGTRRIPIPVSVSAEARAALVAAAHKPWSPLPAATDRAGWEQLAATIAAGDAAQAEAADRQIAALDVHLETRALGAARLHIAAPRRTTPRTPTRVLLEVHGGGLIAGGGNGARLGAAMQASAHDCVAWGIDYRLPPRDPYPAPLDDCVAAYREILKVMDPRRVIVQGVSAGGNLAAALILRARDEGLPLPRAAVLLTPELDLTESGDSFETNRWIDVALRSGLIEANRVYANGHDLADSYLSPLFGDFTRGFPPTFLMAGTRDLFLSNAVRMHRALRRARIPAELQVWEAMPHGGFGVSPEMAELQGEIRRFLDAHWAA